MDGPEPTENNQLIVDEESEHTMLLGRGGIQQQYKGNIYTDSVFFLFVSNFQLSNSRTNCSDFTNTFLLISIVLLLPLTLIRNAFFCCVTILIKKSHCVTVTYYLIHLSHILHIS